MYFKVYCILAHKNPSQIKELISLLDDGKSLFFIHLDKKVNQKEYEGLCSNTSSRFVVNRVSCSWGKYSLVQAALNTMKEIQSFMNANYNTSDYHFIMLSGEDLPLKSNDFIHGFLEKNKKKSFLNYWQLPYNKWWNGGIFRLENLYFFQYKKYSKINYRINRIIKKIHCDFLLPLNQFQKQFPDFKIYGSSQWMILNKDLLAFVIEKNSTNQKFNSVFKYVLAPDELYFATLIMNNVNEKEFLIENIPTHLVKFKGSEASPVYLQAEDLNDKNEKMLFARKFDPDVNKNAIDFLKKEITK